MISLLLCVLFPLHAITIAAPSADWITVNRESYTLSYPDGWEFSEGGDMGTSFVIYAPLDNADDAFSENVNFIIQDLSGYEFTLDSYTELSLSQTTNYFPDAVILKNEKRKSGNTEYQYLEYLGSSGEFKLRFIQHYYLKDSHAYILTFSMQESDKSTYQPIAEKLLSDFKLK